VSNSTVFGSYLKREFLYDETTEQLAPWPSTVEGGKRRYLPFSPRAWKEAKLDPATGTSQEETLLESDSSAYEEPLESREVLVTPEDQFVTTPLSTANDEDYFSRKTKRSGKMFEMAKVKMFRGEKDGHDQDAAEFLDDVQFLAKRWSEGVTDRQERMQNVIRAFRQHLHEDGDAYHWWNFVLKAEEKVDWEAVKKVFMERYNEANKIDDSYGITNEILAVAQREGEEIQDYLRTVERFSKRVPEKYQSILAVQVIKGLRDVAKRGQVSFALRTTKDCTVKMAMETIKDAYREVGEPDPFAPAATEGKTRHRAHSASIPSLSGLPQFSHVPQGVAVHSVRRDAQAVAGRPTTSTGTGGMEGITPEQLKEMWEFYRNQKQGFQMPARNPNVIRPAVEGASGFRGSGYGRGQGGMYDSSHVTCFRCGAQSPNGHFAHECDPANVALPMQQQQELRDQVMERRRERRNSYQNQGFRTVTGSNMQPVARTREGESRTAETTVIEPRPSEASVRNLRPVYLHSPARVNSATQILVDCMPVVRTIVESVMAEKRARLEEDSDGKGHQTARPTKVLMREKSGPGMTIGGMLNAMSTPGRSEELDTERSGVVSLEVEKQQTSGRIASLDRPDPLEADPVPWPLGVSREEPVMEKPEGPPVVISERKTVKLKGKPVKPMEETPPIVMMRDRRRFNLEQVLNAVQPDISFAQLLDCSPKLRSQLAHLLRSSITKVRSRVKGKQAEEVVHRVGLEPARLTMASEESGNLECMHIEVWVDGIHVPEALVDGGAMIDLVKVDLVRRIGLQTMRVVDFGMRMADETFVALEEAVWLNVNAEGVVCRIKAYVVPSSVSYEVLLSRRWLKRMRAKEDHATNQLNVQGVDGIWRVISSTPAVREFMEVVDTSQGVSALSIESLEAEEAVDELLDELDHWDDSESDSEN
jgi:hypothetical protein